MYLFAVHSDGSEAVERPTAAMLLDHPFSAVDPTFKFSDSQLGK